MVCVGNKLCAGSSHARIEPLSQCIHPTLDMASALRQRKPHDKNIKNISEDDEFGKKTTYEPSIIVRAKERVKVGLPMSWRRTRD